MMPEDIDKKMTDEKKTKKQKKPKLPSNIADIMALPDIQRLEGGCYFGVKKMFGGRETRFTIYIDNDGSRAMDKPLFVPEETQPSSVEFVNIRPRPTLQSVFDSLEEKYNKYLFFLDDDVYTILILAVMSTYFREIFNTYPYIDFFSPEVNCGKTTAMNCVVWASFYGLSMVNPTGPVIFRAVDSCHSVIGIDEVDNLLKDPEASSTILGLLNSAYQKGLVAYRIDTEKQMMPVAYDPFGLKVFTHVKALSVSLPDRSIIINMVRSDGNIVPLTNPSVFIEERDMMYNLRLNKKFVEKVKTSYTNILSDKSVGLSNRDSQKFTPLLTIARMISDDCYDKALVWGKKYSKERESSRVDELMRTLVEAIIGLDNSGAGDVVLKSITKKFNSLCFERELIGLKKDGTPKEFGPKRILRMLSTIGIVKSDKRTDHNVWVWIESKTLRYWAKVYKIEGYSTLPVDTPLTLLTPQAPSPNEGVTGVKRGKGGTTVGVPTIGFNPSGFNNEPAIEADIPIILKRIIKVWDTHNTSYTKRIRTKEHRELEILSDGFIAGYVVNIMPGNWWELTQIAKEEIVRCQI